MPVDRLNPLAKWWIDTPATAASAAKPTLSPKCASTYPRTRRMAPGESPPQVRRVPCSDHRCEGLTETVVNGEARLRDSERMGFSGTTGLHHQYFRA